MLKLLLDFYKDHHNDMQTIIEDLQQGDGAKAKRMVHTIKGIAGTFGAEQLFESAINLDLAFKNNEEHKQLLATFETDFNEVIKSIEQFISVKEETVLEDTQGELDKAAFNQHLNELIELLSMMDTASEDKVNELKRLYGQYLDKKLLNKLVTEIENFEFDLGLETIKLLQINYD